MEHSNSQEVQPATDGNDPLYKMIEDAADKLVVLIEASKSRGHETLHANANLCYTTVLDLRHWVVRG